jgi:hypothetical protein
MIGRWWQARKRGGRGLLVFGLALVVLATGCASSRRNPFLPGDGPIHITVVNRTRETIHAVLRGIGEPIDLGNFMRGETRLIEIELPGRGEISVRLSPLIGETYDTFRTRAEAGDRFILQIAPRIRGTRLMRTREP